MDNLKIEINLDEKSMELFRNSEKLLGLGQFSNDMLAGFLLGGILHFFLWSEKQKADLPVMPLEIKLNKN
jgi:hypothetical protein